MRIAPNELALADPHAIQSIYGVNSGFEKTDFYPPWRTGGGNRADHFSLTDEKVHSAGRRIVQSMYSMSSVISCEPKIDNCMKLFLQRMTEYAESGEPIELEKWTQYYAFDAIGELYLSKMFGFMEKRGDFGGYMEALDIGVPSMALAGVTPTYLRPYLWKVLGMLNPRRASVVAALWPCIRLSGECVKNRLAQMHDGSELQEDFLAKLFRIKQEKGEKLNYGDEDIRREVMIALFAGSDTTNAALVSIFYHLMRTPSAYHALQAEVDAATRDGTVSTGFIRYNDAVKLPYLAAVIKEGMRIYPSVGLTLPRVAPPQGARISGEFLPGGTRVGINAAVIHYNEQVFGPEPEKFIPERWLRSKEQVELMDRCLFEFGAGSRTCIGKHVSTSISPYFWRTSELIRAFRFRCARCTSWCLRSCEHSTSNRPCPARSGTPRIIGSRSRPAWWCG